jgi:hypothetical protein
MACHIMGTPNMAMRLGAPTSVECIKKVGPGKYTFPQQTVLRFDFPARGSMPPVKVFWHDSLKEFLKFDGIPEGELIGDDDNNGSLIGDKGMVTTVLRRAYAPPAHARMKDYKLPWPLLTRSRHYADWILPAKARTSCSTSAWRLRSCSGCSQRHSKVEGKLEWTP